MVSRVPCRIGLDSVTGFVVPRDSACPRASRSPRVHNPEYRPLNWIAPYLLAAAMSLVLGLNLLADALREQSMRD